MRMSLRILLISMVFVSVYSQTDTTTNYHLFQQFKKEHGKNYSFIEELRRFSIFQNNLELISKLNLEEGETAEFGITRFADMTVEEFISEILMPAQTPTNFTETSTSRRIELPSPDQFDWRDNGAVTPVKDQGTVGTCWTFSATGNIEGQWFLAGNELTSLSEEQIVDCDGTQEPSTGHADCGVFGGWPYLAFDYIIKAGGIASEKNYPYCVGNATCYPCPAKGYNATLCGPPPPYCNPTTSPCRQGTLPIAATIQAWTPLSSNEDLLKQQLFELGPISVAFDASSLQFYKKGVFAPKRCSKTELNHAVLMVGYGTDLSTDTPFWTIKNSWGTKWGENGYFRIKRGVGMCGINTQAATSIVDLTSHQMFFTTNRNEIIRVIESTEAKLFVQK